MAQQSFDRAQLNVRSARGFFDVGTRPKSDVVRAEVDVANARVEIIRARNAERLARVALNTAMGIDIDTPTQVQDNLIYEPVQFDRCSSAPRRSASARRTVRRSSRSRWPRPRCAWPSATSFRRQRRRLVRRATADLHQTWSVGAQLLLDDLRRRQPRRPLPGGAGQPGGRARPAQVLGARHLQNVEQAEISAEEGQERIQAAQTAVASAQENFRLAQGRFDAGVGTILELTDAQLALTQAQNAEAQALADYPDRPVPARPGPRPAVTLT